MTREEIINEYLKEHRHDVLLNPYAGLLGFAKYLDEHSELPAGLDEAADEYVQTLADRADENLRIDTTLETAFKAGAKWRESQIPVPNDMRDAADEYSATPENKKPVDGEKYKAFVAGAEWMAGRYKFDYTKGHHTAMVLSRECMNEHGWFQREREIIQLTEFIEKLCGYNQSTR